MNKRGMKSVDAFQAADSFALAMQNKTAICAKSKLHFTFLVWVVLSLWEQAVAQKIQAGIQLGATNYYGELQQKGYDLSQARLMFGIAGAYHLNSRLSLCATVFKGNVTANDRACNNPASIQRNLSFATRLYEVAVLGRVNILSADRNAVTPYLFGGMSIFRINPYTFALDGEKVYLIPLATEGQGLPNYPDRKPASWYNFSLPIGGGVSARINEYWSIDLEFGYRKTFTDYIDDVSTYYADPQLLQNSFGSRSVELAYRGDELPNGNPNYPGTGMQRGYPVSKDWYYATLLRLNYTFGGRAISSSRTGPAYHKKQYSCPTVF